MRDDAPGQCSPLPATDDKLHSILRKIINYQHLRANRAAVELEELKREQILSPDELTYHAWMFVDKCLQTALKRVDKPGCHVGALEILAVAPQVARELFGEDAPAVLRSAGIHSSATLGKLIFELIELGRFSKTEEDCVEDFNEMGPFDDLFGK